MQKAFLPTGLFAACAWALAGLPAAPAAAEVRIQGEAILGEPYGVGRIVVDMPKEEEPDALGPGGVGVTEQFGRLLYPAVDQRPFRALIRDLVGVGGERTAVYFLFRGAAPLQLTVRTQTAHAVRVVPRRDPRGLGRMLGAWWQAYAPPPRLLENKPEYAPVVERYLQSMLAARLSLAMPAARESASWQEQLGQDVGVFLGLEDVRTAALEERMLSRAAGLGERADQPLPPAIEPPPLVVPDLPEKIDVEPLAARVPEECLYIRFGSVANFLWFRGQLERASGDFGSLVSARGVDYEILTRNEDQLCFRQTTLSKMLGSTVSGLLGGTAIADAALVGTDLFHREGAAFGMLFQARGNDLLAKEILRQRAEAVESGKGKLKEETVEMAGHKVSFLSSPNGRVRSFYAADGDFHFVTTSRTLARRFLETRSGERTLAAAKDFRHARSQFPAARGDTAFVYLSDAFFRNLTGTHYRVEMARRLVAEVDVTLVQLAVLAAAAEGKPAGTIEELVAGGFLPGDFGPRPDGARAVYERGEAFDSLRGRRGCMMPVPDVELKAVTPSEARMYARFAEHYRTQWGRVDPMFVAIKSRPAGPGRERITIDARMGPLSGQVYSLLSRLLGPADKKRLAPIDGDLAAGEVILRDQRLFAGIRDVDPPRLRIGSGALAVAAAPPVADLLLKPLMVGYVGAYGDPGLLGTLNLLVPSRPDANGYAGLPGGLWRRQFDRFTVYSFQSEILANVTPRLRFEESDRAAQVRLRVADPTKTRLAGWLNGMAYGRTRDTSVGNLRLLHQLEQQLHVPGEDCRAAAELVLNARLICPLRGQYVYQANAQGMKRWTTTALDAGQGKTRPAGAMPEGFLAPPLDWFRGLDLVGVLGRNEAEVHAEVAMETGPAK